ncbi:MAG: hypothetical protein WCP85_21365 [Mariniphaga sp.]
MRSIWNDIKDKIGLIEKYKLIAILTAFFTVLSYISERIYNLNEPVKGSYQIIPFVDFKGYSVRDDLKKDTTGYKYSFNYCTRILIINDIDAFIYDIKIPLDGFDKDKAGRL